MAYWRLEIKILAALMIALIGSLSIATIHAYALSDPYEYPNSQTAPDVASVGGTCPSGGACPSTLITSNARVAVGSTSGSDFTLYGRDGLTASQNDNPGSAQRPEGLYDTYADFEVIIPTSLANSQSQVPVRIIDACQKIGDGNGWEDHGINQVTQYVNAYALQSSVSGGGYGVNPSGTQGPTRTCNGSTGDLVVDVKPYLQTDQRYGTGMEAAVVEVYDSSPNQDKKYFAVRVTQSPGSTAALNGANIFPTSTSPYPNDDTNNSGSDTYGNAYPSKDGLGYGIVNLFNPAANYFYEPAGNCDEGSNPANCPQYSSMNEPVNSQAAQPSVDNTTTGQQLSNYPANGINNFNFYFSPDCNYKSSDPVYLKWERFNNTNTQTDDEYWTLTDLTTGATVVPRWDKSQSNDSYDYYRIPARTLNFGDRYEWTWNGVDNDHGLSVWMPFSEFTGTSGFNPNSCGWALSSSSTVSPGSIGPGSGNGNTATFSHTITNNGPSAATSYTWQIEGRYNNGNWVYAATSCGKGDQNYGVVLAGDNCPLATRSPTNVASESNSPSNWTIKYTFPPGSQTNDQYCQRIEYTYATQDNAGETYSTMACTTYHGTTPNGGPTQPIYNALCSDLTATSNPNGGDFVNYPDLEAANGGSGDYETPATTVYINMEFTNNGANGTNGGAAADWTTDFNVAGNSNLALTGAGVPVTVGNSYKMYGINREKKGQIDQLVVTGAPGAMVTVSLRVHGPGIGAFGQACAVTVDLGYTETPAGEINHASCVQDGSNGANGAADGWTFDTSHPGNITRVGVIVAQEGGGNEAYNYGAVGTTTIGNISGVGVYYANQTIPGDPYPGHDFSIPINMGADPFLTGYRFMVYIYPLNDDNQPDYPSLSGLPNPGGGGGGLMLACSNFTTGGQTKMNLNSLENPTAYTVNSDANVAYATGSPRFSTLGLAMGCSVTATSNGNNMAASPPYTNPNNCTGTFTPQSASTQIAGPDGPVTNPQLDDNDCSQLYVAYSAGIADDSGYIFPQYSTGPFSAPPSCEIVQNEPYVHFFGADVEAGGGFLNDGSTQCTNTAGGINTYTDTTGYNNGGGSPPVGSGVQIGALSIGPISGFSSALIRGSPSTGYPAGSTGLSFANTSSTISGTAPGDPALGGSLGSSYSNCETDYFDETGRSGLTANTTSNLGDISTASGYDTPTYYDPAGGTLTISGGTIADSSSRVIYVKGNVEITHNIQFADSAWGDPSDIASLYIIAEGGNIYVQPGVSELDGIYVAQPDPASGAGGAIDTCANGTSEYTPTDLIAACNSQLVVNGSFVDQATYLHRAFSSMRYSSPGESYQPNVVKNCGVINGVTDYTNVGDCAAEIFNFDPALLLSQPSLTPASGPTSGKYDYITSLSPLL